MSGARFLVRGRVQGVWFRASARERAIALGLRGLARNLDDGSVEVIVVGEAAAIDELQRWLAHGPELALVSGLERQELAEPPAFSGFDTR